MQKFAANVARDARVQAALHEEGYRVVVIWECETEDARRLKMIRRSLTKLK